MGIAHLVGQNVLLEFLIGLGFTSRLAGNCLVEKSCGFLRDGLLYRAAAQALLVVKQVIDHLVGQKAGGLPVLRIKAGFGFHRTLLNLILIKPIRKVFLWLAVRAPHAPPTTSPLTFRIEHKNPTTGQIISHLLYNQHHPWLSQE
jgi:hypothetical protein